MFLTNIMKTCLSAALLFTLNINLLISQGININGIQSDFRVNDLYENIKNQIGDKKINNRIKGTPYFDESFKLAEVLYFGKLIKDRIYLRYNAYSDEMEISSNPMAKVSEKILLKNNKVACIIGGEKYRYLGFIAEKNTPSVGYLKELFNGIIFSFYQKKYKIYMEATTARTSLERSFPARFVEKTEYYYSINNGELNQLKLSKKKILSRLKNYSILIKSFIKNNGSNLKSLEDVIAMFNYLDQA